MHRKGSPVPLVSRRAGSHNPIDGTIGSFQFRGASRSEIIGQLQFQGWKETPKTPGERRYNWKAKLSMVTGGVIENTNYFGFIAPETGYAQSFEINMAEDDQNWTSHLEKQFFFKLPTHYARGTVTIDVFHDLYFSIQYFVNPDGSANLENDTARQFHEP